MHIPTKFKENNIDKLYELIKNYPLGTLISSIDNNIDATHVPFYLNINDPKKIKLEAHIARKNSLFNKAVEETQVLVIFHGPNEYISPNYYASKAKSGKVVPTWNYVVVHMKGHITFIEAQNWILQHLEMLFKKHETVSQDTPWSISDAPETYISQLAKAVIGITIEIEHIVGNFKLSQNKPLEDYNGVLEELGTSNDLFKFMTKIN